MAIDKVVDEFLCQTFEGESPRQIISLGAGLDSRYFRFYDRSQKPGGDQVTTGEVLNEEAEESTFVINGKVIRKSLTRRRSLTTRKWAPGLVSYFEVDFPDIVDRKRVSIQSNRSLSEAAMIKHTGIATLSNDGSFKEEDEDEDEQVKEKINEKVDDTKSEEVEEKLKFDAYSLISADLRDIPALDSALLEAAFDPNAPTLFIAECVLVYLPDKNATDLLKWACGAPCSQQSVSGAEDGVTSPLKSPSRMFAAFEMTNPNDAFGKVMVHNLRERGVDLHGMIAHPTLESQMERFTSCGWCNSVDKCGWDMLTCYNSALMDSIERMRIEGIEGLDELEEWELLMQHYCLCMAYSGDQVKSMFTGLAHSLDTVA